MGNSRASAGTTCAPNYEASPPLKIALTSPEVWFTLCSRTFHKRLVAGTPALLLQGIAANSRFLP